MSTKKETAVEEVTTEKAQETVYDPWKDMKPVFIPQKDNGDQEFVFVEVNGRPFQVPCGETMEVPRPVYEALLFSQRMRDEARKRAQAETKRMIESAKAVNL